MVSRERLLRLGAALTELGTSKRARAIAQILLAAAIVFAAIKVRSLWHGSHIEFDRVTWVAVAGALLLGAVGTAAGALIWLAILEALNVRTQRRWAGIFFQAQLGKYLPGSVWQYAGRAAAARAHGIPLRPVGLSLPVEFVASAAASGVVAALLLGWWGLALITVVALLLLATDRVVRPRRRVLRSIIRATLLYLPAWLLLGVGFWLCARGLVGVPAHDIAFYTGAFAVAFLAGLLAIYAPGGLGVREAVLVALLSGRVSASDALIVAAASRLILVLVDVSLAGIATATLRRGRPRLNAADTA
jgi:glycosyltransferase 2 family protein